MFVGIVDELLNVFIVGDKLLLIDVVFFVMWFRFNSDSSRIFLNLKYNWVNMFLKFVDFFG